MIPFPQQLNPPAQPQPDDEVVRLPTAGTLPGEVSVDAIFWQEIDPVAFPDTATANVRSKCLVYAFHACHINSSKEYINRFRST